MTIRDYSVTANDNTTIGGIGLSDTMLANALDNAIRELMADSANHLLDISAPTLTTGAADTYALATGGTVSAYADKLRLVFRANATNTGASTLNVDSLGATNLKVYGPSGIADVSAGQIQNGGVYDVVYVSAISAFVVLNPPWYAIGTDVQAWDAQLDTLSGISADNATAVGNLTGVNSGDEVALAQSVWDAGTDTTEATLSPLKLATVIGTHTTAPDYALEKASVSGADTIEFTAEDLSQYYQIRLRFQDCAFAAATGQVIEFSTDGGATWLGADFNSRAFDDAGTSAANTINIRLVASGRSSSISGGVLVFELNVARRIQSEGITDGKVAHSAYGPNVIPNAVRFRATASTFTAGSITLLAWK